MVEQLTASAEKILNQPDYNLFITLQREIYLVHRYSKASTLGLLFYRQCQKTGGGGWGGVRLVLEFFFVLQNCNFYLI